MKTTLKDRAADLCDAVHRNVDELMEQLNRERRYHRAVVSALLGCIYRAIDTRSRDWGVEKEVCDFLKLNYRFDLYTTEEENLLKNAIELWAALGDEGHSRSLFNLGVCYQSGFGVEQDPVRAAELFKNAADLGCKFGIKSRGKCLRDGSGVAKNEEEAVGYFLVCLEHGSLNSGVEAAKLLWKSMDAEKQRKALRILMVNALSGHVVSRQKFVRFLSDKQAQDVDILDICQELKRQATAGNAEAQFLYGICLLNGKEAPEDLSSVNPSSPEETQEKAGPHNSDGNVVNGASHEQERSSAAKALAVKMLQAAALQGHTEAQYHYWLCWRDRVSDEANETLAEDFLIAAKNNGHVLALGDWAISLKRKSKNPDKETKRVIFDALWRSAHGGHVEAAYECGMCYLNGFGTYRSKWGAASMFKMAAQAGHVEAQYEYARCLEKGTSGTHKDVPLATYYYQAAAEAGHVAASKKLLRSSPSP